MEEGDGSGLRVAQRCRSAQAGDVADLTRASESGAHGSLLARAVAPGHMAGYPWSSTASQPLDKNSLAGFVRQRDSTGIPCARALSAKIRCLRPGGPCGACPRLSGFGSVSSFQPIRTSQAGAASERVGLNQHGRGRLRVRFRLSSATTNAACPMMRTRFEAAPFFIWLGLPDSSGRGFCARFSGLCGTRWSVAGVGSNQHRG
jgi:hypothetical protein